MTARSGFTMLKQFGSLMLRFGKANRPVMHLSNLTP